MPVQINEAASRAAEHAYAAALAAGRTNEEAEEILVATYYDNVPADPAPAPEPVAALEEPTGPRNPFRQEGDLALAEFAGLTLPQQAAVESGNPGLSARIFAAEDWDASAPARLAAAETTAREAEIESNPQSQIEAAMEKERAHFRSRFWSFSPSERLALAADLGVDPSTFPSADDPRNWAAKEDR